MDWFTEGAVCQGDPGNSGYTCNLRFLSEISRWSLFDWYWEKSSAGRNRLTKQGRSSPWAGREKATTSVSASTSSSQSQPFFCLHFCLALSLWCHINLPPREHTKVDLFWLYGKMLLRWRFQGNCRKKKENDAWSRGLRWWRQTGMELRRGNSLSFFVIVDDLCAFLRLMSGSFIQLKCLLCEDTKSSPSPYQRWDEFLQDFIQITTCYRENIFLHFTKTSHYITIHHDVTIRDLRVW